MLTNQKKTATTVEKKVVKKTNVIALQPAKDAPIFTAPDFNDANQYLQLHKASLNRIAWEFLRRNPAYQQSWTEYAAKVRKMAATHLDPDVSAYAELMLSSDATQEDIDALGDSKRICDIQGQLEALGHFCAYPDDLNTEAPLDFQYGQPWGLSQIIHPNAIYDGVIARWNESASHIPVPLSNGMKSSEKADRKAFGIRDTKWIDLRVDASFPLSVIDAQLKDMVRYLRDRKIREGVINPINNRDVNQKRYAEYLRILDASAAGFATSEIGKIIEPARINQSESRQRDKRYAAALLEAKRLRDGGYKVLPLLAFPVRRRARQK